MWDYMFYNRDYILNKIEEMREKIDFVECFINGYEDTCAVIFENDKYVIEVNEEKNILSNTLCIQGIRSSYKSEPTMKMHFKDGSDIEFPCFEIKKQTDITNDLHEFSELLKNKGVLKYETKAKRDVINELKNIIDMISNIK